MKTTLSPIFVVLFFLSSFITMRAQDAVPIESAKWIAAGPEAEDFDTTYAAPYFRKSFTIDSPVEKATARVTGAGYFEFYLNGKKVGNHQLDPVVTRYDKRMKYVEFDVTEYVEKGENVAGGIVGNGFYNINTESAWNFDEAPWRNRPAFICAIEIGTANGKSITVVTDSTWRTSTGPITFNQLRNGEYYDARREFPDWASTNFKNENIWAAAVEVGGPSGELTLQKMPPIRKIKALKPVKITEPNPGIYLVDFGQNIAGWANLVMDEAPGTEVVCRYGERIFPDGTLDQKELSRFIFTGETQTTRYLCNGTDNEQYEPRFTYFGFRYLQIEGLSKAPEVSSVEAYMMNTAFDTVGYFECSNPLLNQLHQNIQWSYLGNYHSFPEDCPHREKMGWTGDAQLVVETGLFNFDAASAYYKWLQDFADEQRENGDLPGIIPTSGWGYLHGRDSITRPYGYGPQWEGAVVTIPWQAYRWTGDTAFLADFYPMMKKYVGLLTDISKDYLLGIGIDDHKAIITKTEGPYLSAAYYHWLTEILLDAALILGKDEDADMLKVQAAKIKEAFNTEYFNKENNTYGNEGQTALAVALGCGVVPEELEKDVLQNLLHKIEAQNYLFDAGVVGVKKIIDVLMEHDKKEVLYKMAMQTDFPSFGNWIEKGATTMWQNWDGSQSRNHIMFGSIGDYFYKGLAGINPVDSVPGFGVVNLQPQFPAGMDHLKSGHKSPQGWLHTTWGRNANTIRYTLTVPDNTTVYLNAGNYKAEDDIIYNAEGLMVFGKGNYEIVLIPKD